MRALRKLFDRRERLRRPVLPMLMAALVVAAATACVGGEVRETDGGDGSSRPRVMAALGDSITRAFAACGRGGDCVEASWSTGMADRLDSHWQRLGAPGRGRAHNLAVSGARVAGLASQVEEAVAVRPDYVTVLIGANDACAADESAMTSVEDFTAAFGAALDALARQVPDARILVLSVPNLARLWEVGRDRPDVRRVWAAAGICQSMLVGPTDTSAGANARRDRVRGRVQAYNRAMAAACERHAPRCRHDRNAVFDYRFDLDDVSSLDFWHPSRRGQATLARISWKAGFWA